jgi:hypothetical protein
MTRPHLRQIMFLPLGEMTGVPSLQKGHLPPALGALFSADILNTL